MERSNGKERTESKCRKEIMICGTGLDLLQSSGDFPCGVCRNGQQQHRLQALGAQEMQWAQVLDKGH